MTTIDQQKQDEFFQVLRNFEKQVHDNEYYFDMLEEDENIPNLIGQIRNLRRYIILCND